MVTEKSRGRRRTSCRLVRALGVGLVLLLGLVATPAAGTDGRDGGDGDRSGRDRDQGRGDRAALVRSLDGRGNNRRHPSWGQAGRAYRRAADVGYADGLATPAPGPSPRQISNRVFDDNAQNIFSEHGVTQWGFAWGQFVDHSVGLRQRQGGEHEPMAFGTDDPLERFRNDLGAIDFERTPAAPGTGGTRARQQINTADSYIDASAVYGNSGARLEWLREGPVDGDLSNNGARLLLPDGQLPAVIARGDAASAPETDVEGRLRLTPDRAVVAGDPRAGENAALQATQLLFAREHNRIVDALPPWMPAQNRFEIARTVVAAEQQYITYREFLPAIGVRLDRYRGYDPRVDATLSNEFAVVGYRAHSMVHGELEPIADAADVPEEQIAALEEQGIEVEREGDEITFVVPLGVASFNPDLVTEIGLGPVLHGLGGEPQYRNDEMIDDQMRSVLFQIPGPTSADPAACLDGPTLPDCFQGVVDLGAIDIQRGRDHGMPSYNELRESYGLAPRTSFRAITGEATEEFPDDPEIDAANPLDDPDIMDFVEMRDGDGNPVAPDSPEADGEVVTVVRRTTLAARLKALYGDVDSVDPFVGMLAEPHLRGSELGELQHAIWREEFERLRDGDRFFYANDPRLFMIRALFGIDHRRTLSQVIVDNTELEPGDIEADVFHAPEEEPAEEEPAEKRAPAPELRGWRPWPNGSTSSTRPARTSRQP